VLGRPQSRLKRKLDLDSSALADVAVHTNLPPVALDDLGTHRQPESRPALGPLGGEERVERATADLFGHAHPVVLDDQAHVTGVSRGRHPNVALLVREQLDRVQCVDDEVCDDLQEPASTCTDRWQLVELGDDLGLGPYLGDQQLASVSDHHGHVHRLDVVAADPSEAAQILDDRRNSLHATQTVDDERIDILGERGIPCRQRLSQQLEVDPDERRRVVDLVGHLRRNPTDQSKAFVLLQSGFELTLLGDVSERDDVDLLATQGRELLSHFRPPGLAPPFDHDFDDIGATQPHRRDFEAEVEIGEQVAGLRVREQHLAVGGECEHRVGHGIEQPAEVFDGDRVVGDGHFQHRTIAQRWCRVDP